MKNQEAILYEFYYGSSDKNDDCCVEQADNESVTLNGNLILADIN